MKPSNALSNCATLAAVSSDIWQILFGLLLDLLKIIMTWPRFEPGTSCTQSEPSTIWLPCHITRSDLGAISKKMSHFRFLHSTHISIFGILVKFYINKIMYNQLRFYANFHLCTNTPLYANMAICQYSSLMPSSTSTPSSTLSPISTLTPISTCMKYYILYDFSAKWLSVFQSTEKFAILLLHILTK